MNKFEKIKFVSIGGSNDTGDGSFELPYRTIQYAMSDVPIDELGWRVVLLSGSYDEPNLDLLPNIPLQAMIPNTVTITSPIIFAYNGNYSFNGITPFITDNYAFTCNNNLSININFTDCNLTAIPTTDAGCGIFNINNATFNISIVDSLLSIQNYQELVSIVNTTTNSNGVISLNSCELKAIKSNQIQLDASILFLNGNTKVIIENSKIYGQIQIENNASINANKTNLKTSQSPVVVTNSPTTSRLTHCNIDCETNPVIDGLGTLQVAECCFLNNGTRFSTTLNNNTGIYYLPTTSPRLVDQALPQSIQSGALYYAQGDFYDDRTSRFRIPQADQTTGVISPDQLPDAEYGEKGVNFLISVRKGATKQSVIDLEAGNNMEIDTTDGVAIFNAEGQLTNKVLVELADGTTEAVSKLKQGSNMDWVIDGETVTQSATGGGESYEIGDGLQTTLNPDTGKEILSSKADATQFTYDETGATILTAEVQQDLAKGASSVQSVNNETPDAEGNVDIDTGGITPEEAEVIAQTNFNKNIIPIQQEITNNKLIINDVFINKINNGENVTIDVDPATNTATFSATGGSGGANKVTVSVNGANPVPYNVDENGNIAINIPLTTSLTSNLLLITTETATLNKGKTNLHSIVSTDFSINNTTNELDLSTAVKTTLVKADTAIQTAIGKGSVEVSKQGTELTITGSGGEGGDHVYPEYWKYTGTPTAKYDKAIIPSITDIVFNEAFPNKSIYIAMEIIDPPVSSYNYKVAIIKTGVRKDVIQKTDNNILVSGIIDINAVHNYYNNQPSQAGKSLVLQFINTDLANSVTIQLEQSDITTLDTIASAIQAKVRLTTNLDLKTFTCKTLNNKLYLNSNNTQILIQQIYYTTGYPLTGILQLMPNQATIIHDYEYVYQFETNPKGFSVDVNNYGETYFWTSIYPTDNMIQISTAFVSFKMGVSLIAKNFNIVDYNRLLVELTSDNYQEIKVENPNQYYNRIANTHGSTGTKKWLVTNNILPAGVSYSPQILMQYNNDEINASADKKLYAIFDFAKYPFDTSEFILTCTAFYKQVIAPIASYELFVKIIVKNQNTNGKYTINNAKDDVIISLGMISPNMWQNGVIENKFNIQCDNNNIIVEHFLDNKMVQGGITMNTGIGQGQINLGLGKSGQWDLGSKAISPNPDRLEGVEFDANSNDLIITGGKILSLRVKGTFTLSNTFSTQNTKLRFGLVNTVNSEDFFSVEIPFVNQAGTIQAIDGISFNANMTYFTGKKAFKVIPYSEDVDENVNLIVQDFLSLYLQY